MVLLHVLQSLAAKYRWKLSVAHFNHQLRGPAADADERLVRRTAARLRLPFFGGRADVRAFARQSKLSLEMAGRKLRHEFLAGTARRQKIHFIALAHHADDQVELFFLRLLRGAGGEGMGGMKWSSPSPAGKKITLVRPLLGFTKQELLAFAGEMNVAFRQDATNFTSDHLRNRIRNELLPLLQDRYQPALGKTVLRLMEITGAEGEWAGETARRWLAQPEAAFGTLAVAVQRKILQFQLARAGVVVDFELVERLRTTPDQYVSTGPGLAVARDASAQIHLRRHISPEFKGGELKLTLQDRAGEAEFAGRKFVWKLKRLRKLPGKDGRKSAGVTEYFDAGEVGSEIILRHWQAGDRFQPIGLKLPVKLQDLFVNAKIPASRRRELALATTRAGEIFWVEGLRIGERFKWTGKTVRTLVWNQPK